MNENTIITVEAEEEAMDVQMNGKSFSNGVVTGALIGVVGTIAVQKLTLFILKKTGLARTKPLELGDASEETES